MSNGLDFERQVHALLKNMGFEAEITKASGDGGIDIIAHSKEHITGGKYIIQCKDWSKPVGEPPVRDLYGVVTAENANKGILITTSSFTSPAINFAAGKPLELIDGTKFNQLLSKYSLAGIEGEASSTADDERIKALTEQLDRNPKNILVMKELADIYLLQGDYNRAAELYERLGSLQPSIETERLNMVYWGGLNNYGVALAKNKRYDEALTLFKRLQTLFQPLSYPTTRNEAELLMYLGLYDIAISVLQNLKSYFNNAPDSRRVIEGRIELAYTEEQPDFPFLLMLKDTASLEVVQLETATQKTAQEGKSEISSSFESIYSEIHVDFVDYWQSLTFKVENDLLPSQPEDELHSDILKHSQLMDRSSPEVLAIYGSIAEFFSTEDTLQESKKQAVIVGIEKLKLIHDALKKFNDAMHNAQSHESWVELKNILLTSINDSNTILLEIGERENIVIERCNEEYAKAVEGWEIIISQEKAEWREKLRNTLYKDWSPK